MLSGPSQLAACCPVAMTPFSGGRMSITLAEPIEYNIVVGRVKAVGERRTEARGVTRRRSYCKQTGIVGRMSTCDFRQHQSVPFGCTSMLNVVVST